MGFKTFGEIDMRSVLNSILHLVFKIVLGFPFWLVWTDWGIGTKYFFFLPNIFQTIPLQECMGLFIALSILSAFIPKFSSVEQNGSCCKT